MTNFLEKFRLGKEKEDYRTVITNIYNGVVFRGTNLWILIFAIFVASLGLNINSPAVIIGAMLISPLMGPIMGIGLGMGINDLPLLRKALYNYLIATGAALTTSTVFFLVSPLNEAHSEILARTAPNIYDVLIAFFGGLAGIVATSSKHKGNVIPGVAIATALMPPLCTAGYGLATFQFGYFFGAFYLFIINTVFIAWATFIFVTVLKFPQTHLGNARADKISHRIVWLVVLATLLPSIYFGYDIVRQDRFTRYANNFILNEAHFPNDYLLDKKIIAKDKKIILVFGGEAITEDKIEQLRAALAKYGIRDASLDIKQGFAYLGDKKEESSEQVQRLTEALDAQQQSYQALRQQVDSAREQELMAADLYSEIKAQYPAVRSAVIQPAMVQSDSSGSRTTYVVLVTSASALPNSQRRRLENWLKLRLKTTNISLVWQR